MFCGSLCRILSERTCPFIGIGAWVDRNPDAMRRRNQIRSTFRMYRVLLVREGVMPGVPVEAVVSAVTGERVDGRGVLPEDALQLKGKRGQAGLL
jgi:hypothetical protein